MVDAPSERTVFSCGEICLPDSWLSCVDQSEAALFRSAMDWARVPWSPWARAAWACAAFALISVTSVLLRDFAWVQTWLWSALTTGALVGAGAGAVVPYPSGGVGCAQPPSRATSATAGTKILRMRMLLTPWASPRL